MTLYEVLSKERQKFDKVYGRNLNSGSVRDGKSNSNNLEFYVKINKIKLIFFFC